MKKFHLGLICIIALTILMILPTNGFAGSGKGFSKSRCYLYDNFNSGYINQDLWDVDDFPATITVEGGRAKFVHDLNESGNSSWLIFKKRPEKIKEIRVKVWVEKAPGGDPRVRIGGWHGEDKYGNIIWNQFQVRPELERVDFGAFAFADPNNIDYEYELFWGYFKRPIEILDKQFKLIMGFDRSALEYEESSLGELRHELKDKLHRTDEVFKGIGTRNNYDYDDDFIVYFDDVYVCY